MINIFLGFYSEMLQGTTDRERPFIYFLLFMWTTSLIVLIAAVSAAMLLPLFGLHIK